MTQTAFAIAQRLGEFRRQGRRLVWLFDYDGTLVPLQERPADAQLPAAMRQLLQQLSQQPRHAAGIISGRVLDEVRQLVGLPGLYYAGTTGLEVDLRGVTLTHPEAARGQALIALLKPLAHRAASGCPGAWVEEKRLGLTLHYRAAPQRWHEPFCTQALHALRPWASQLRVLSGPLAIEVTARLGWTKGSAVGMMIEDAGPEAVPIYVGDGPNDADAVRTANSLGGLTVGIGVEAPADAHHRLPDPAALARLLTWWLQNSADKRHVAAQLC